MRIKSTLMDQDEMDRALTRIAHEILEKNRNTDNLVLVGIQRRGVPLANILAGKIERIEGQRPLEGKLDITFYRDDLSLLTEHPIVHSTNLPFDVNGKTIVLVDDVLFTGRTVRAAIEALFDMGRASSIQLAVMVDRGHRELPLRPDFVGKNVPTSRKEFIKVSVQEFDGRNAVELGELEE
ncbi:MAG: bifunctional pyr operon transcriptional regulator/uracil phosphoribosyltransferase PyrR [Saccharofermentanales bacterium]|jgi:pyrimidine operon attenuation protein/uracil phosphoribosyltransferase|nr:bifunctional pyr operon transcriptional regulator/uracil phosphoribosyltransferase PyrR [Bacillota bacterium]NLB09059.1 bifunctional pyr operon transcriptional regulator/uracil phosphoribosyltransferase PyrR [Clostridiales bacterium]